MSPGQSGGQCPASVKLRGEASTVDVELDVISIYIAVKFIRVGEISKKSV